MKPAELMTIVELLQRHHFYNVFEIMDWIEKNAEHSDSFKTVKEAMDQSLANIVRGANENLEVSE